MRIRTLFLLTSLTAVFGCPADDDDDTDATATDPTTTTVTTTASTTDTTTTASTTASTTDSTESGSESSTANPETGSESGSESGSTGVDTSGSESGGSSATCESYCTAYELNCATEGEQYADHDACISACNAWEPGSPGDASGNTQECHLYHAMAASGDPVLHCPHSQENAVAGGCV